MRETKRTQQQPIPSYRGPYYAAAQTCLQLDFRSGFWQPVFALFENKFSQNLLRCNIFLIDQKS